MKPSLACGILVPFFLVFLVTPSFGMADDGVKLSQVSQRRYHDFLGKIAEYKKSITTLEQLVAHPPTIAQLKQALAQQKAQKHTFQLSDQDKADLRRMMELATQMDPPTWEKLLAQASANGKRIAAIALSESNEEQSPHLFSKAQSLMPMPAEISSLPQIQAQGSPGDFIVSPLENFIDGRDGNAEVANGISYSKQVISSSGGGAPIIIGGGFPFNQTQFTDFNEKVSQISKIVDFYDPICNGVAVLYDAVLNHGSQCQPHLRLDLPAGQTNDPAQLLLDEMSMRYAYIELAKTIGDLADPANQFDLSDVEKIIFRATRLSYQGISLYDQARGMRSLTLARGYEQTAISDNRGILVGLSYGGLVVAKAAAMFPQAFKSIVMFSPGTENPAHVGTNADLSAAFEMTWSYRRILVDLVHTIAMSPRYDVYVPQVLGSTYDKPNFRDSLQKKMLGELDLDIASDLNRVQDRLYIVTGGLDNVIDPQTQIAAMRAVFNKNPQQNPSQGTYVLVPTAGHAQWGNPEQSNEPAVLQILAEIEKGDDLGALKPGNVYEYLDGTNGAPGTFVLLGAGNAGLDQASAIVAPIQAQMKARAAAAATIH